MPFPVLSRVKLLLLLSGSPQNPLPSHSSPTSTVLPSHYELSQPLFYRRPKARNTHVHIYRIITPFWKWVTQLCPTLCDPLDYTVRGILQARIMEWIASPGDLPNSGIEPRSPTLQADSLPAELQEKPKSTGVGSLSLCQEIFPTQESNWGLPNCRQILYQLSYQGSPDTT